MMDPIIKYQKKCVVLRNVKNMVNEAISCRTNEYPTYDHIDPKKGKIIVSKLSPIVIMRKFTFKKDEEELDKILPELQDCDESQFLKEALDTKSQSLSNTNQSVAIKDRGNAFVNSLTQEDLNNHIQKCLEMSSENKITLKNAFALQLIDCMKHMMHKKDLSAMACTLDAGAKIYSCRVDSLYQQVSKLADEVIIMKLKEGQKSKSDKVSDVEEAKGKRRANKRFVIASADSLRRKPKEKDPRDRFIKIEGKAGSLMLNASRDPKDLSLTIEKNIPFWPNWETYTPLKSLGTVALPQIKIFRDMANKMECPFKTTQISTNENKSAASEQGEYAMELDSVEGTSPEVGDDASNSAEDTRIININFDEVNKDVVSNCNYSDQEVNLVSTALKRLEEEAAKFGVCERPSRFKAMKVLFADINDDYNYLSTNSVNYWAGPDFWKRPYSACRNNSGKKKLTIRKKSYKEIVYDFEGLEEKWNKMFKRSRSLGNKTLLNWKKQKTTTSASDKKMDVIIFLDLFQITLKQDTAESDNNLDASVAATIKHLSDFQTRFEEEKDRSLDTSDSQDTLNDCFDNNAAENSASSEDRDHLISRLFNVGSDPEPSFEAGSPGNIIKIEVNIDNTPGEDGFLVPAPKIVSFEPVKYAVRPIRVDMYNLKTAMNDLIHREIENDVKYERSQPQTSLTGLRDARPTARFSAIIKTLPQKLDRVSAQDVSPGMAFLALLTLANENNFELENDEQLKDVVVKFEADNNV